MRSIIEITANLFSNFSIRKYGKPARWIKLSKDRQKEWVEDSYTILEDLLKALEKDLKPVILTKNPSASYERGYYRGSEEEKERLRNLISDMKADYLEQLREFIKE